MNSKGKSQENRLRILGHSLLCFTLLNKLRPGLPGLCNKSQYNGHKPSQNPTQMNTKTQNLHIEKAAFQNIIPFNVSF